MHAIEPLISVRPPSEVWQHEPTYLVGEVGLSVLTLLLLASCLRERKEFFVAIASFFGGALIELYTILEPQIGNFYHSQASIMTFGKREPLYMLVCLSIADLISRVATCLSSL
jgi:hypothetical protein